jgi:Spy/CpxP family protein refolding chaperone
MLEPDRASWQNPRILGLLLTVFILGGVVGALVMKVELHDRLHRASATYSQPACEKLTYERLCKDLNLTSEQSSQLRSILDDYVKYNQSLQDQVQDARATGKSQILRILNADQRQHFEQLVTELPAR